MIKEIQSLLYSTNLDTNQIKTKIDESKKTLSIKALDHQIILAFSINYEKIPILVPFLSKPEIEKKDFVHFDQELLFHLLTQKISFPLSILSGFKVMEKCLCDELKKENKFDQLKEEEKPLEIRENTI